MAQPILLTAIFSKYPLALFFLQSTCFFPLLRTKSDLFSIIKVMTSIQQVSEKLQYVLRISDIWIRMRNLEKTDNPLSIIPQKPTYFSVSILCKIRMSYSQRRGTDCPL